MKGKDQRNVSAIAIGIGIGIYIVVDGLLGAAVGVLVGGMGVIGFGSSYLKGD